MSLEEKTFNGAIGACLAMDANMIQPPVDNKANFQAWMSKVRDAFPKEFDILTKCKLKSLYCF